MTRFGRWLKFNAVGALGMAVQLAALAALIRIKAHYLVATAMAIEIALLHNFVWHLHYTWRDRRGEGRLIAQLARFHLSNGIMSMAGNLTLMPVLVRLLGLPVVLANGMAILVCSVVNFFLGDAWVFARSGMHRPTTAVSHEDLSPGLKQNSGA